MQLLAKPSTELSILLILSTRQDCFFYICASVFLADHSIVLFAVISSKASNSSDDHPDDGEDTKCFLPALKVADSPEDSPCGLHESERETSLTSLRLGFFAGSKRFVAKLGGSRGERS